jgi:hypothetical protein
MSGLYVRYVSEAAKVNHCERVIDFVTTCHGTLLNNEAIPCITSFEHPTLYLPRLLLGLGSFYHSNHSGALGGHST